MDFQISDDFVTMATATASSAHVRRFTRAYVGGLRWFESIEKYQQHTLSFIRYEKIASKLSR